MKRLVLLVLSAELTFLLIAGFTLSMFSCNVDSQGTITIEEIPADSIPEQKPYVTEEPDLSNEIYFSESELSRIAALIDLLPEFVVTGFEEKYLDWKNTWKNVPSFHVIEFAKSEEYEIVLSYCMTYGKAIWPLLFEKLHDPDNFFIVNIVRDMSPEYIHLYEEIVAESYRRTREEGVLLTSGNSDWIAYCKILLEQAYEDILKSIQDISIPEESGQNQMDGEDADKTVERLNGTTWKLEGIVDVKTDVLKLLEPEDCDECYTITFDTDTTFTAVSIWMESNINLLQMNPITEKMLFCEKYEKDGEDYCDSDTFIRAIHEIQSYSVSNGKLRLVCSYGNEYLSFVQQRK